jgi:Holliday junction DNA helicase RuvA
MIGIVSGVIEYIDESKVLVNTASGIGYEVNYSYATGGVGSDIKAYTYFIVRENLNELFGFETLAQKNLFSMLLGVKGVGPRSAYSLITSLGVDALIDSILLENKKVIKQAPGIGPKAAAQIILDLKDKMTPEVALANKSKGSISSTPTHNVNTSTLNDALSALSELGYKESDVLGPINAILSDNANIGSDDLVREVLRGSM